MHCCREQHLERLSIAYTPAAYSTHNVPFHRGVILASVGDHSCFLWGKRPGSLGLGCIRIEPRPSADPVRGNRSRLIQITLSPALTVRTGGENCLEDHRARCRAGAGSYRALTAAKQREGHGNRGQQAVPADLSHHQFWLNSSRRATPLSSCRTNLDQPNFKFGILCDWD